MKVKFYLPFIVVALSAGCGLNPWSTERVDPVAYQTTPIQAEKAANALGILMVIDNNEITDANIALAKSSNPMVRDYAKILANQHSQNLQATVNLSRKLGIAPLRGKVAIQLENNGKREAAKLNALSGRAFDRAYIDAMVKGHRAALHLIDHKLNQVTNPLVSDHLMMTRTHVAGHLHRALKIQHELH